MIRHRAPIPYAQSHGSGRRSASGVPLGFRVLLIKPYAPHQRRVCTRQRTAVVASLWLVFRASEAASRPTSGEPGGTRAPRHRLGYNAINPRTRSYRLASRVLFTF